LQRSNDDLRQFAYVASHDLREPLRMVKSYLGIIKKRMGAELDDATQRHMASVVDGAT
jgi:light-regulated signal transduction histidine kinase (bacteriophytochrome)